MSKSVLLAAIGTRGDIEPFLTLGQLLQEEGYSVHYSLPQQLCHLVDDPRRVHPLTEDFLNLIHGKDARLVMGRGSRWAKARAMYRLYRLGAEINTTLMQQQEQAVKQIDPDLIVFHSKCFYPFLWHLATGLRAVLLTPVPFLIHPVNGYPHIGFTKSLGQVVNRWTYRLITTMIAYSITGSQRDVRLPKKYGVRQIKRSLRTMPIAYAVSPTIVQRPIDWPDNAQIVGYYDRKFSSVWQAPESLSTFLDRHDRVLFLTFGSMVNDDPPVISKRIYQTLYKLQIPTIVNCADGGLVSDEKYAAMDNFYFLSGVPYSWLLPQVDAMICHGGAGTTHQALLHSLPTMIIPHIMDQYVWAKLVHGLGAGPAGLPLTNIDTQDLAVQIHDLWTNNRYQEAANKAGRTMVKENNLRSSYLQFVTDSSLDLAADDTPYPAHD